MPARFDHEKPEVCPDSLAFRRGLELLLDRLPKSPAVRDQPDRASNSVPRNLAEGNGKFTGPDRGRYFDYARDSVRECALRRTSRWPRAGLLKRTSLPARNGCGGGAR